MLEEEAPAQLAALALARMSSPEPSDRVLAVELAGRVATPTCLVETINAIRDPDAGVRYAATVQLKGRLEAVPALVGALHDADPTVRAGAAHALAGVEHDDAVVALIGALQDPQPEVQRTAIEALVARSSPGLARRIATTTAAITTSVLEALLRMGVPGQEALIARTRENARAQAEAAKARIVDEARRHAIQESARIRREAGAMAEAAKASIVEEARRHAVTEVDRIQREARAQAEAARSTILEHTRRKVPSDG